MLDCSPLQSGDSPTRNLPTPFCPFQKPTLFDGNAFQRLSLRWDKFVILWRDLQSWCEGLTHFQKNVQNWNPIQAKDLAWCIKRLFQKTDLFTPFSYVDFARCVILYASAGILLVDQQLRQRFDSLNKVSQKSFAKAEIADLSNSPQTLVKQAKSRLDRGQRLWQDPWRAFKALLHLHVHQASLESEMRRQEKSNLDVDNWRMLLDLLLDTLRHYRLR